MYMRKITTDTIGNEHVSFFQEEKKKKKKKKKGWKFYTEVFFFEFFFLYIMYIYKNHLRLRVYDDQMNEKK